VCRGEGMDSLIEEVGAADIVVSCLPAGVSALEPGMFEGNSVLMDANYHGSVLEGVAERAGCRFIGGAEWLLAQAVPAFELFVGKKAPVGEMRDALFGGAEAANADKGNIALVGFMGAGKSAVAREIAEMSGREALSTDEEIEGKSGKSIKEIFAEFGEEGFRRMEREEIAGVSRVDGKVIDCGGGAVLDEGNVEMLRRNSMPVWLWARAETAVGRIGKDAGRPLLDVEERLGAARKISWGRRGKYAKTAELVISTEGRSAEEIAGMILHETGEIGGN
jgi:shikimate kinase